MRQIAFLIFSLLCMTGALQAQIDRSQGGILIKAEENKESSSNSGLELKSKPSLSNTNNGFTVTPNNSKLESENKRRMVDMTPQKSKFIDQRYTMRPKWAENNHPVDEVLKGDQNLGNVKTDAKFVELLFRDFGQVDGDRVRIFLNEEVIEPNVVLQGGYYGMLVDLKPGFNKIDFQALNMGSVGPNTADLKVLDDNGTIISSNLWNLATGYKATIIVVK